MGVKEWVFHKDISTRIHLAPATVEMELLVQALELLPCLSWETPTKAASLRTPHSEGIESRACRREHQVHQLEATYLPTSMAASEEAYQASAVESEETTMVFPVSRASKVLRAVEHRVVTTDFPLFRVEEVQGKSREAKV